MEKVYWLYILECSDGSFYTGSTSNLEKRLTEHQQGISKCYTYSRRPVTLVFSEYFTNSFDAFTAERQIKRWSRAKKKALIKGDFILLHALSECKNDTNYHNKGS